MFDGILQLRWQPLADLRFRIVPLLAEAMHDRAAAASRADALAPVREALEEWALRWRLEPGTTDVGAALAMYWHLEPDGAREFFIPRHILARLEAPRPMERILSLPEMPAAAERLQERLKPINQRGCLLVNARRDRGWERLGAVDSVVVVEAGRNSNAQLLFKFLGYDSQPDASCVVAVNRVERKTAEGQTQFRFELTRGGDYLAETPCHPFAWHHWLWHRTQNSHQFSQLDAQLYEVHRLVQPGAAPA